MLLHTGILIRSVYVIFIFTLVIACGSGGGDGGDALGSKPGEPVPSPRIEVKNVYRTVDPYNNVKLLGEVQNTGDASGPFIRIEFVFYDVFSNVLGTESTYIVGNCLTLTDFETQTDTCLKPGEIGYFSLRTNISNSLISRYTHTISFRDLELEDPKASLVIIGEYKVQEDEFGYSKLVGEVRNEGILTLALGIVTVITKDKNGNVVNIAYENIEGDTVYVPEMGKNADSGLRPGSTGTFCVDLGALPSGDLDHITKTSWNESYRYGPASPSRSVCNKQDRDKYIRELDFSLYP